MQETLSLKNNHQKNPRTLFKMKLSMIEIGLNLHSYHCSYGKEVSSICKHINWISIYNSEQTQYFGIVCENTEFFLLLSCYFNKGVEEVRTKEKQIRYITRLCVRHFPGQGKEKKVFPDIFYLLLQIVCYWPYYLQKGNKMY